MNDDTLVVSIGRNIGEDPMSTRTWEAFRGEVRSACETALNVPAVFDGMGIRMYEGRMEDSATLIFNAEAPLDGGPLARRLAHLAWYYGQDSIAFTAGQTRFVGAERSGQHA